METVHLIDVREINHIEGKIMEFVDKYCRNRPEWGFNVSSII